MSAGPDPSDPSEPGAAPGPSESRDPDRSPGSAPAGATERKASPPVRLAIEFGPLVVFFLVQRLTKDSDPKGLQGLYWATIAFMAAISAAVVASRVIERRWPVVPLVTAVFVLVMGGLTLWLNSELFIMLKPTLVNALFAAILLVGLGRGKLYLKLVLGEALHMAEEGWTALTLRFGLWFVFLAVLNEVARQVLDVDDWTTFKTFGLPVLTVLFMLSLAPLLKRHLIEEPGGDEPPADDPAT